MKFKKLIKLFTDINHYTNIANIRSIKDKGLKASNNGVISAIPSEYDELSKSNYPKTQKELLNIYNYRDEDESIPVSVYEKYPLKYRQLNIMDGDGMSAGYELDPVIRVKAKTKNDNDINRHVKAYREDYDIDPRIEIRVPESNIDQSSLRFQVPKGMSDAMINDPNYKSVMSLNKDGEPESRLVILKSHLKSDNNYLNDIQSNKDLLDMDDIDTKNNVKSIDAYKAGKFKSRGKIRSHIGKTNNDLHTKEIRDRLAKSLFKYRHNDTYANLLRNTAKDAQKDYYKMTNESKELLYGK